jgi:hypothetical protein
MMGSTVKKMVIGALAGATAGLAAEMLGRLVTRSTVSRATDAASTVASKVRDTVAEKASQGRITLGGKDLSEVVHEVGAQGLDKAHAVATEQTSHLNGALRGGVDLLAHLAASLAEPSR